MTKICNVTDFTKQQSALRKERVKVLIFGKIFKVFDYWLVEDSKKFARFLCGGHRVLVPFQGKFQVGLLLGASKDKSIPEEKLLGITAIIDEQPTLSKLLLDFIKQFSKWWSYPWQKVVSKFLPKFLLNSTSLSNRHLIWCSVVPESHSKNFNWRRSSVKDLRNAENFLTSDYFKKIPQGINSFFSSLTTTERNNRKEKIKFFEISGAWEFRKSVYLSKIKSAVQDHQTLVFIFPSLLILERCQKECADYKQIIVYHGKVPLKERMIIWKKALSDENMIIFGLSAAAWLPFQKKISLVLEQEASELYRDIREPLLHFRDILLALKHGNSTPFEKIFFSAQFHSLEIIKAAQIDSFEKISDSLSVFQNNVKKESVSREHFNFKGHFSNILLKRVYRWINLGRDVCIITSHSGFKNKFYCIECQKFFRCFKCFSICAKERDESKILCLRCKEIQSPSDNCFSCHKQWTVVEFGSEYLGKHLAENFMKISVISNESQIESMIKKNEFNNHIKNPKIVIFTLQQIESLESFNFGVVILLKIDAALHSSFSNTEVRWLQVCSRLHYYLSLEHATEMIFLTNYPEHPLMKPLIDGNFDAGVAYLLEQRKIHNLLPYFDWVGIFFDDPEKESCFWSHLSNLKNELLDEFKNVEHINILGPMRKYSDRRLKIKKTGIVIGTNSQISTRQLLYDVLKKLNHDALLSRGLHTIEWDPKF